jgi:DNA-directed RNA polymerase subunit M/transcription elongation factor TFIIS
MLTKSYIDLHDYVKFLKPYKKGRVKTEFECPNCTGKLSVNRVDGTKFDCYDCGDRSAIRKALLESSGEKAKWPKQKEEERKAAHEQRTRELEAKAETERLKLLPSSKRHEQVLSAIASSQLKDKDRKDLTENRKLTPEIIEKYRFYSTWGGWTAPAVSYSGMLIESQHKLSGAYKWIAYGNTKRHETGQNPLTFHGSRTNPTQIILVEGLVIKPILTAERYPDSLVIGASGGQFTASSQELLRAIKRHPDAPVVWMADGGSVKDTGVMRRIKATHALLKFIGREMMIGWWGQIDKGGTDIDEIDPSTKIHLIALQKLETIQEAVFKVDVGLWTGQSVARKRRSLEKNYLGGDASSIQDVDRVYRNPQGLKQIIEEAIKDGVILLDRSGTGSGKSSVLGAMENPEGINQFLYVNDGHRNPTTPEIEISMADNPSRHNGLFINPGRKTPLGNPWVQTSQPDGENWERTQSNCHLAEEQRVWASKGYANNGEKNVICQGCEHLTTCATSRGEGWGYMWERGVVAQNARVAISPLALAPVSQHNYGKTGLVYDDQPIAMFTQLTASLEDVRNMAGKIARADRDLYEELEEFFDLLENRFETPSYFGHTHLSIFEGFELPNAESILNRVMQVIQPNALGLIHKGNDSPDRLAKYGFKSIEVKPRLGDLITNWLGWSLEILAGKVEGVISIAGNTLTVKHKDNKQVEIISEAAVALIMSATLDPNDLAKQLKVDVSKIRTISQPRHTFENLNFVLIDGMSSFGKQRVDSANERINNLCKALIIKHGSCIVLDHLKSDSTRALWYRDSTGSNRFKEYNSILSIGVPTPNLAAIADEFFFLTGNRVDPLSKDPEYQAYVKRKVAAECIQAAGRLRAQHRKGEQLFFYIASDKESYPIVQLMAAYPGVSLVIEDVLNISPEAAKPIERTKATIAKLIQDNPKITMVELAKQTGKPVTTIKDYFRDYGLGYKKGRLFLYRAFIGKASLLESDYSNWETLLSQEYVDEHLSLLNAKIDDNSKAIEIATRFGALNNPEVRALFAAIGHEATNHTIDLLTLNLYLQVDEMKLSETGDSIEDLVEGLDYIVKYADVIGLEALRDKFSDDKESMQLAASKLPDAARRMLAEMVIMGNKAREYRVARDLSN